MRKLIFAERAWNDYLYWQDNDKKMLKKTNTLLKDIARNGNTGIGKPESLRHREGWSRRINDEHRIVYLIKDDNYVEILQCKGHYDD